MNFHALEGYRAVSRLAAVSKRLHNSLQLVRHDFAVSASTELIASGTSEHEKALLNLSGNRIGALECKLLCLVLSNGWLLPSVTNIWLQNNTIGSVGLRWIARGLRDMPTSCRLSSISLGGNPFLGELHREALQTNRSHDALVQATDSGKGALAGERHASYAVSRALDRLDAIAAARRVKLRLRS